MNTIARELLLIAKSLVGARTMFKDVPVGGIFHNGIGMGMGATSGETHVMFFEKIDKSSARTVKSDAAPRQLGVVSSFRPFSSVWPVDKLPTHDTRQGL